MARNERIFIATYPDGRKNFEVRIGLNAAQHANAMKSHGNTARIEGARNSICIQVRKAIHKKYGVSPQRVRWEHLRLKELTEQSQGPENTQPKLF